MPKLRFSSLLPAVNQTEVLTKFFGATVDQLFQPGTSQKVNGYIGQIPSYYDPTKDFYVNEPTEERQVYQLEASMITLDSTGAIDDALVYPDLLAYIETSGGVTGADNSRLFETDYYAWAPPVDIDKLTNFKEYRWFGDSTGAADLPILTVASPVVMAVADGVTNTFALPPSIEGVPASSETPAAYVNNLPVASTLSGGNLVLASTPPAGARVMVTRFNDLAVAMNGSTEFPLAQFISSAQSYNGDGYTTTFPVGTTAPTTTGLYDVLVFVNGVSTTFTYDATTNSVTLPAPPAGANSTTAAASVQVVSLNGLLAYTDRHSTTLMSGIALTPTPSLTSGMRIRLLDCVNFFALWDESPWDTVVWDTPAENVYMVDGVGSSIRLTPDDVLVRDIAAQYVLIDRSSLNRNGWSIRNNWVHRSSYAWSGLDFPNRQAVRPIIEFLRDIVLYDYGTIRGTPVSAALTTTTVNHTGSAPITVDQIAGSLLGTVSVDGGVVLTKGMLLLVAQSSPLATSPLNQTIQVVGAQTLSSGDEIITLTPYAAAEGTVLQVTTDSGFGAAGTEVYLANGKWLLAQQWSESTDPLFMIYDTEVTPTALNDSSRYPGSDFAGNRIFGFAGGSGATDPILRRSLRYDVNGYIVFQNDAVVDRAHYLDAGALVEIDGLYCYGIDDGSTLTSSSLWHLAPMTTKQTFTAGNFQSVPLNLQANPLSADVTTISQSDWLNHFAGLIETQTGFTGNAFSVNNYRDTARNLSLGTAILQLRAPLLKTMLLASNTQFDMLTAIRYADQEYARFRNKFARKLVDLRNRGRVLDGSPPTLWVSTALDSLKADKSPSSPFVYSRMAGGQFFIPPTPAFLGMLPPVQPAMITTLVYGHPVLMIQGHDGSLTPAFNDWRDPIMLGLEQQIYASIATIFTTDARPVFDLQYWMGGAFYQAATGYSAAEVQSVLAPLFERWAQSGRFDYRTNGLFNQADPFTWNYRGVLDRMGNPLPGSWRAIYRFYFDTDRPDEQPWQMLGFWQKPVWWDAEYPGGYGRTNTKMWSDLEAGLVRQGSRAAVATYIGDGTTNTFALPASSSSAAAEVFVQDPVTHALTQVAATVSGGIATLSAPPVSGATITVCIGIADVRYARPGLSRFIPVDDAGNILDPLAAGIVPQAPTYQLASRPWLAGDGSPAEALWWDSPAYRFALAQAGFLLKPARMVEILWNTTGTGFVGPQWLDFSTNDRPRSAGTLLHGEIDPVSGNPVIVIGVQQWLVDNLLYAGASPSILGTAVRNLDVRLVHRMSGFTSATDLSASADSFGVLTSEDIQVIFYESPSLRTADYTGVVVEWTGSGYAVVGYNARDPFFTVIPPNLNGPKGYISTSTSSQPTPSGWRPATYYAVGTQVLYQNAIYECTLSHMSGATFQLSNWTQLGAAPTPPLRVTTYNLGLTNFIERVPYGTVFASQQQVADFLLGLERYQTSQGWVFDTLDSTTGQTRNWSAAVRDFLSWSQVQWSAGNFIALSPGAETLKFSTASGTVLNVEDASNGFYGLVDRSGQPIGSRNARVTRIDGNVGLTPINSDIFGARVRIADIEHALVFSNITIFNDNIYLPLFNMRQARIKIDGIRTQNWVGRLDAPGYVISGSDILPSFDKNVEDIRLMFEIEKTDRADFSDYARHLLGYQARSYMENLLLEQTEQFEFYQGMVQAKGSPGVFSRLLRSQRINADSNIVFLEEYAFRIDRFGAPPSPRATFMLLQDSIHRDPQIIRFASTTNAPADWFQIPLGDTNWLDTPPQAAFFPAATTSLVQKFADAGPVRISDVAYTAFHLTDLGAFFVQQYGNGIDTLLTGERAWIYDNAAHTWDVLRAFDTAAAAANTVNKVTVTSDDPTVVGFRLYFDQPLTFTEADVGNLVVVDGSTYSTPDQIGIQQIIALSISGNWIEVAPFNEQNFTTASLGTATLVPSLQIAAGQAGFDFTTSTNTRPVVRVLRSMRFASQADLLASGYAWTAGDIAWLASDPANPGRYAVVSFDGTSWTTVRQQPDRMDPTAIKTAFIYAEGATINGSMQIVSNEPLVPDLTIVDPLYGEIPGVAMREIDFIVDFDPATYNAGAAPSSATVWGADQVGRVWWNTRTVRFLDPYTDTTGVSSARDVAELTYRAQVWGQIAPNTSVDVYEWVASDVPPSQWATMAASDTTGTYSGTVFQSAAPSWVEQTVFDPSVGAETTIYYFWVTGRTTVPDVSFRHTDISTVAATITNPTSAAIAWLAPINADTLIASGVASVVNAANSALMIKLESTVERDLGHDQWTLIRPKDPTSLAPDWMWRKLRDSLAGFDDALSAVPSPALNPLRATGILPGQSMFVLPSPDGSVPRGGLMAARQSFVGIINSIFAASPMVIERGTSVAALNAADTFQNGASLIWMRNSGEQIYEPPEGYWDIEVYSVRERNRLLMRPDFAAAVANGTRIRVLVNGLALATPQWAIWWFNPAKAQAVVGAAPSGTSAGDAMFGAPDAVFDLGSYYDYYVQTYADRNALVTSNWYGQNIVINNATMNFFSTDVPQAVYQSTSERDIAEGVPARHSLVEVQQGSGFIWTAYDNVYGWITVAASFPPPVGTRVYVASDETADGFWTIYTYDPSNAAADAYGFVLELVQRYRTSDFFLGTPSPAIDNIAGLPVVDWYAQNVTISGVTLTYSAANPPMVSYPSEFVRDQIEGTPPVNQFVQIATTDATTGAVTDWYWTAYDTTLNAAGQPNGWQIVARKGATIQLSPAFYDPTRPVHGLGAPSTSDVVRRDGSWEMRFLADALRTSGILLNSDLNEVLFSIVHFIHAQQDNVDWIFKTSFINIAGYAVPLTQTPISAPDITPNLVSYVNEVKPYRAKVRNYIEQYSAGTDAANVHATDFDNPVYYDPALRAFRPLDPNNAADAAIMATTAPWKDWWDNYQLQASPVRRTKVTMLFDRVTNDVNDGYDGTVFGDAAFDGHEVGYGTAADRIAKYYQSTDPITGLDVNSVLTYSYGAPDLLNTRFKGNVIEGNELANLVDPAGDFDATWVGGFDMVGFDTVAPAVPQDTLDVDAEEPYDIAINAPTSDQSRAISDEAYLAMPDGNTATIALGGLADPAGYGLIDPYAEADKPEERAQVLSDDGLLITVRSYGQPGAPPQRSKVFDTSDLTGTATLHYDQIAESAEAVLVWRDGVRAALGTDYTVDLLGRNVTVDLGTGTQTVVVQALGIGATGAVVERHLVEATGLPDYGLTQPQGLPYIAVTVGGQRVPSTEYSVAGSTLTFSAVPAAGEDVTIVAFDHYADEACLVNTVAAYSGMPISTTAVPPHAGVILERNGVRMMPPPTYYAPFTADEREIVLDVTPSQSTPVTIYVDGVYYPYPVPLVSSGYSTLPYGAVASGSVAVQTNSAGSFAFLGNRLVSLDPTFTATVVAISIFEGHDYEVDNGTLNIVSPVSASDTITATTFTNDAILDVRTYTFKANAVGEYWLADAFHDPNYAWVTVEGLRIAPGRDFGFRVPYDNFDEPARNPNPSYDQYWTSRLVVNTGTIAIQNGDWIVATVFEGAIARNPEEWRAATRTPAALRMLPIPDDGGYEHTPFDLQPFDEHNDWVTVIPAYDAVSNVEGQLQPVPVFEMDERWEYVRINTAISGTLAAPLGPTDQTAQIVLADTALSPKLWATSPLALPEPGKPGIVWVGSERIEYGTLTQSGSTVTIGNLRRGSRGTAVSEEARTVSRQTANGIETSFSVAAVGDVDVAINGQSVATTNAVVGMSISVAAGVTTVTFASAPASGSYVTVGVSNGIVQPVGTSVFNGTLGFEPQWLNDTDPWDGKDNGGFLLSA